MREEMHGDSTGHTGCALLDAAGCWRLDFVLEAAVSWKMKEKKVIRVNDRDYIYGVNGSWVVV